MGGISTGRDALEFLAAGATSIALGTILFSDLDAPSRVRRELADELASQGIASERDATGLAHASGPVRVA
jgi:dihydroorotate dehydrogenase (NAD+) catalytic subunit